MPKIPTFQAKGSIEQLQGTTTNIQMGLNNTLANALSPITDMVVNNKIQQNDTQNRTEALRLGNEFTRKMNTLEDTIANDNTGLGVNKEAANNYYKEQTNNLISEFKLKTSNSATSTLFTNNALTAVNRGIYRIDTIVDKNVFKDLGNQVKQAEKSLITQALFNNKDANIVDEFGMLGNVNDFDYASLQTNLTKLYTDAYSGKIPAANLNEIINNIPSVVQGFQANKDIYDNPSFAYTELNKGENSLVYPDLQVEERTKLINKVKIMMVQPMQTEFANVIFSLQGKGTEQPFDFNFAKKILPIETYNKLKTSYDLAKINAEDVKFIRTSSLNETNKLIESKKYSTDSYAGLADKITQAKLKEDLIKVRDATAKQMQTDPVQLQIDSNPEIAELFNDYINETDNPEIKISNLKIFTNAIIEDQKRLGVPLSNQKIMSNSMAEKFVTQFKQLGFDGNSKARTAMLKSLQLQYGDLSDKVLTQLMTAGLPKGTKVGLVLGTEQTINEFMSFDDPKEVEALKNFLARQDDPEINLEKIKTAIVNQSDYGDIYDINRQNVPFDISGTITEMDEITDVLSLYAAKLMFGNPGMSVNAASKEASLLFSNNYRVEDTYFLPRKVDGRDINDREMDTHVKILDTIKYNYLQTFEAVAYKSNKKDVPSQELTEKMNYNLINNGEWRNSADGEGSVYGIVLSNNSFGIVVNENGEELFVKHGDNSYTLPGSSGIEIDINLPSEQEKKQYRGYYGYAENLKKEPNNLDSDGNYIGGKRENLDNNEMQNALENSGASTVEIPNPLSVIGETMIGQVESSEKKQYIEPKNIDFDFIKDREGFEITGKVPDAKDSKSGVTIASGFDLGARKLSDLNGLDSKIIEKLKPYLGLKGNEAVAAAKKLKITKEEGKIINEFAKRESLTRLKKKWNKDSKIKFDKLSTEQATVLASVAFQYGSSFKRKDGTQMNFYSLALNNDWQGVYDELMDFKDNYPTRRKEEAAYLKKYLEKIK